VLLATSITASPGSATSRPCHPGRTLAVAAARRWRFAAPGKGNRDDPL